MKFNNILSIKTIIILALLSMLICYNLEKYPNDPSTFEELNEKEAVEHELMRQEVHGKLRKHRKPQKLTKEQELEKQMKKQKEEERRANILKNHKEEKAKYSTSGNSDEMWRNSLRNYDDVPKKTTSENTKAQTISKVKTPEINNNIPPKSPLQESGKKSLNNPIEEKGDNDKKQNTVDIPENIDPCINKECLEKRKQLEKQKNKEQDSNNKIDQLIKPPQNPNFNMDKLDEKENNIKKPDPKTNPINELDKKVEQIKKIIYRILPQMTLNKLQTI